MSHNRFVFVYIPELAVIGEVVSLGAHSSRIKYILNGETHVQDFSNEEFIERGSIGYEDENEQGARVSL